MAQMEFDRRTFLKLGLGGGLIGSAALGVNEYQTLNRGIETPNGTFIPLYEFHTNHVTPDRMPKGTNIYFTELSGVYGQEMYERDPIDVVDKAILDKKYILSQNNTELMVGDVTFNGAVFWAFLSLPTVEAIGGVSAFLKLQKSENQNEKLDSKVNIRREILKKVGLGLSYWLITPVVASLTMGVPAAITGFDYNNPVARIGARIGSFLDYLHPEHAYALFRSLVMADKLLEVAKDYKERTGKRPQIAFNVGAGHAQIEDFLQAGQGICRKLITMHPYPILQSSFDGVGGVDNFCTARLFKVVVDEGRVEVGERKVIDQELRGQLEVLSRIVTPSNTRGYLASNLGNSS